MRDFLVESREILKVRDFRNPNELKLSKTLNFTFFFSIHCDAFNAKRRVKNTKTIISLLGHLFWVSARFRKATAQWVNNSVQTFGLIAKPVNKLPLMLLTIY